MYCDKWEDWTDCCRDNTDRSCEADSLGNSCEDSADNADDSDDSTARLMTASVVRLIVDSKTCSWTDSWTDSAVDSKTDSKTDLKTDL